LISSGSSNRQPLRYRFAVGAVERFELDLQMTTTTTIEDAVAGTVSNRAELPVMRSRVRAEVTAIDRDGDATIAFVWEDFGIPADAVVDPPVRARTDALLHTMIGLRAISKISNRGVPHGTHFEMPATMNPALQRSMTQMEQTMRDVYAPLPETPVGIGAEWETTVPAKVLGTQIDTVMHYRLVEIHGDAVRFAVTTTQHAADAPLTLDNGMTAHLEQLSTIGGGAVDVSLGHLVPIAEMTANTKFSFTIESGGQTAHANAAIDLGVTIRPAK